MAVLMTLPDHDEMRASVCKRHETFTRGCVIIVALLARKLLAMIIFILNDEKKYFVQHV